MLSIITPVLNGSRYIENTILSIKELKIPYEHIIVDGGSTDSTLDIINKYPDVKLVMQKQKLGMYHAIDMGINISKGKILTWVNSDDKIIASGYEKMYKEMINNKLDLVYSNGFHHFVDEYKYKSITAQPFARYFLKKGIFPFVQTSSLFSKNGYEKVGGFDYSKFKIIGDRDLFQKMAYDKTLKMKYIPIFSSVFLRYEGSLLYKNLDMLKDEHTHAIETNNSLFNRAIYHLFRVIKNNYWKIKNINK